MSTFLDYMRCGSDSAQCISVHSQCDGVQDCVNGWDEEIDICVNTDEQAFFQSPGLFNMLILNAMYFI